MTITVAIVTARRNEDTNWEAWHSQYRPDFLMRRRLDPLFGGELAALIAACCATRPYHHLVYQLRALTLQTMPPDQVVVMDRLASEPYSFYQLDDHGRPLFHVDWHNPGNGTRSNAISFGCYDKNQAIRHAQGADDDVLVMLDDCCLPGFGLVEAVHHWGVDGPHPSVLMLGHRKLVQEEPRLERADANWESESTPLPPEQAALRRRVFGIWAMRYETLRELNGYNELLDGSRHGLDEELLIRCDRYLHEQGGHYCYDPVARVWEIGHGMPWASAEETTDWRSKMPASGWRSPKGAFDAR